MKNLMILLVLTVLCSCTAPTAARKALDAQGFTDIEITGWAPFSCGEDDAFSTGFRARNVNGKVVQGVVCSGLIFKNSTIRW